MRLNSYYAQSSGEFKLALPWGSRLVAVSVVPGSGTVEMLAMGPVGVSERVEVRFRALASFEEVDDEFLDRWRMLGVFRIGGKTSDERVMFVERGSLVDGGRSVAGSPCLRCGKLGIGHGYCPECQSRMRGDAGG